MMKIKRKAFSLVETIMYIALVSTMLVVISSFFAVLVEAEARSQTINEVDQQATLVMQQINRTVRNSTLINSPAAAASAGTLSVNTVTVANNPTTFGLSGGYLQIKEGAAAAVNLTSNLVTISGLSFTNLSAPSTDGTIRYQFTISYSNSAGIKQYDYSQTFYGSATLK